MYTWSSSPVWVSPHGSLKYAVVTPPSFGAYAVMAVHAVSAGAIMASQAVVYDKDAHYYQPPIIVSADNVMAMLQTSEAAWKYKRHLEAQDREAPV